MDEEGTWVWSDGRAKNPDFVEPWEPPGGRHSEYSTVQTAGGEARHRASLTVHVLCCFRATAHRRRGCRYR